MRVSIIIPSYGEDHWREMAEARALPSANKQEPHEVLIGHDPDGTIAAVRNDLGHKATGDWLLFLDADDELAPGFLVAMQRVYERRSRGGVSRTPDSPPPLLTPAISYVRKGRPQTPRFLSGDLSKNNHLVVGTLVHRGLFREVGGFEDYPHGFEDWSLWAKCWKAGARVIQVRRAVYIAYVNEQSKHRVMWRDREHQARWHERIQKELFPT